MKIYHGSIVSVKNPQILTFDIGRDFGFAFYTTNINEQAERWAVRRAKIAARTSDNIEAIVNCYDWDEDHSNKELSVMRFSGPSMEWLEMVLQCRTNTMFKHAFDIVIGNIANDNVGETVTYVQNGIMRKEDAIARLRFEKINNQIAFCTIKSLEYLHFLESYKIGIV